VNSPQLCSLPQSEIVSELDVGCVRPWVGLGWIGLARKISGLWDGLGLVMFQLVNLFCAN